MNRQEYLLVKIMEECAEVAHRVGKALTFGMQDVQKNQDANNHDRLMGEFTDLVAVMEMAGLEPRRLSESAIRAKKEKVEKYMAYSQEHGTLDDKRFLEGVKPINMATVDILKDHVETCGQCRPHMGHMPFGFCQTGIALFEAME